MALRVLFLNPEAALGGAERCLEDLAVSFTQRPEHEVICSALLLSPGPLADRLRKAGVPTEVFALPEFWAGLGEKGQPGLWKRPRFLLTQLLSLWRWSQVLKQRVAQLSPDVIHSNGIKTHLLWGLATLTSPLTNGRGDVPVVWHVHDFLTSRRFSRALLRFFSRKAYAAVANSTATLERAQSVLRCALLRIYNGVSEEPSSIKRPTELASCRIGLVATYAKWKGHDLFFEAIAKLKKQKKTKGLKFYVIGGPIYRSAGSQWSEAELTAQIAALEVDELVKLVPFTESQDELYAGLDIVVNASTAPEPFGRTVVEAMARGKAVIVPRHGGITEIARHEMEGLHFAPEDAFDLAAAIERLAAEAPFRKRLGAAARERVAQAFSTPALLPRWRDLYRQAVGLDASPTVLVATGFPEDGWHSMRNVALNLFGSFENETALGWTPHLFGPSLGRAPRLWDRRLRYPAWMPERDVLVLLDHSYADCIVALRSKFKIIIVAVNDFYFLHTKHWANAVVRNRILEGLKLADVRIAISESVREEGKKYGVQIEETILYGAEPPPRSTEAIERLHGCLVHVGGTAPRKGVEKLFSVLKALPETFFLVQVGSPFTAEQRARLKRMRLLSRVRETGFQTTAQVWDWYRRAHAVVIPSLYEGFSLPAVEARRTGAPVFLNEGTPAYEVLREDPGTVALPFTAVGRGGADGRAALDAVVSHMLKTGPRDIPFALGTYFDWTRVANDYADVIENFMAPHPALSSRHRKPDNARRRSAK